MSKKEISFTEGPVFQSLLRFAIPVLGALILQAAYGAVDLLIVGKFGNASSISAVGTGSSFMQMATFIITSLAMGSTVIIGHHIGEQKPKEAGNAVGTTIILFLIIAVIMTFVLEFAAGGIAHLLQAPAESFDKTILYIRICSAGIVIIIAYNVISGVLRGVGNANLPLLFVGIACVINILGDLLLVGVFHMDVAGAAIATVFAQFVSVVCSVVVLRKQDMPIEFSREQCRIYKEELRKNIKRRCADRTSGDNGSDFISCRKFCYQSDGSDAICRIWNCTENRFLYYAGSVLYHAECISICCAEYRCRKEKPGMEGFLHCNYYRMFRWNHHLYGRILRRRSIILFLYQ